MELDIFEAVKNDDLTAVQKCINNGVDVNATDEYGDTPLHIAVFYGYIGICELLLKNKANVNAINKKGSTPLHIAELYGYIGICELLLDNGANVNITNEWGDTPSTYSNRVWLYRDLRDSFSTK